MYTPCVLSAYILFKSYSQVHTASKCKKLVSACWNIFRMSKRKSDAIVETSEQIKRVGRLSYNRFKDRIGGGSFGNVFKGKFLIDESSRKEINVAIKRIDKQNESEFEKVIMKTIEPHPNILKYYCIEEDGDFMYVVY